ncbi:MAG TPA: PQQ-binding-like beta-propeller repeat protein [Candidatus Sulfotelmatobacter sp.]|nr:PQQ-binding-like beta-propeller repeat protein [Candidatus Sulfotelmatobacter sp.]
MNTRFLAGIGFLLLATAAPAQRTRPSLPPRPPFGWPKYCGTTTMSGTPTGESPISAQSISRLSLAWQISLKGPIASEATVLQQTLYVGDWSGTESAINVRTGAVMAQADLGRTQAPQCTPPTLGITSSAAVVNGRLYVAGGDDAFYALNPETLAVMWRHTLGDNSADGGYYGWSSPTIVEGRVLQGVASNCDDPFVRGRLVALDRFTGEEVASAYFIGEGKVGNGIWTSPAVDSQHRKIFVTTASGLDYADGLGYSIVRLDLDSLAIEDSWKVRGGETWDADWGSSPTLFEDANGNELVGAGHKDGHYYAFARSNLAAGPLWTAAIAQQGEIPQEGDGTLSTAAFDGVRLYVGGGIPPGSTDPAANGSVVAIDPTSGTILWRRAFPGPVIAPVSTVNGVVFAAGGNLVEALDATTGKVLWSHTTAAGIYGGIAIAGDTIFVGDLSGTLYAFRVGGPAV